MVRESPKHLVKIVYLNRIKLQIPEDYLLHQSGTMAVRRNVLYEPAPAPQPIIRQYDWGDFDFGQNASAPNSDAESDTGELLSEAESQDSGGDSDGDDAFQDAHGGSPARREAEQDRNAARQLPLSPIRALARLGERAADVVTRRHTRASGPVEDIPLPDRPVEYKPRRARH